VSLFFLQDLLRNLGSKLKLDCTRTNAIKKVHFSSSSSYISLIRSKRNVSVHNNIFCLGHRGLVSKRESTCPQGDFSVTEIGDSTREGL
jgi:hypothetical protein